MKLIYALFTLIYDEIITNTLIILDDQSIRYSISEIATSIKFDKKVELKLPLVSLITFVEELFLKRSLNIIADNMTLANKSRWEENPTAKIGVPLMIFVFVFALIMHKCRPKIKRHLQKTVTPGSLFVTFRTFHEDMKEKKETN